MKLTVLLLLATFSGLCQHSLLPDPKLTPGAINPAVTQANIKTTICVSGWTSTVRPPASYTDKLKLQQMAARGLKGRPSDYEEDHFIPLTLGGDPRSPLNLWPEPWPEAKLKDHGAEDALHKLVCSGKIKLVDAQAAIRRDWTAVYFQTYGKTAASGLKVGK